jgi:hypothetical protein
MTATLGEAQIFRALSDSELRVILSIARHTAASKDEFQRILNRWSF